MARFKKWAEREYGIGERITATLLAGTIFVVLIPTVLVKGSAAVDGWLGLPAIRTAWIKLVFGGILASLGFAFAMWAIIAQILRGRGTPLPVMATQSLLTSPPFSYCRNPMSLGTMLGYLGISFWTGSLSAFGMVFLLCAGLLWYLKNVEEGELEERFGPAYREYKETTPFIIPRFR